MLKNIYMWILTNVFKIKTETTNKEVENNNKYARNYEDIKGINYGAIFSNKLANYIANDSTLSITGDNARSELLNKTAQSMWKKIKRITSMSLGYGGVLIVPYVQRGKIYYNIVPQDRITIDSMDGELITGATVLAERKVIHSDINESVYLRWTNYSIENNTLTILQQYTDSKGNKIPTPSFWQNIQEVQSITNVDRVPFGYIKSSINNRNANDKYGVPITYGCEETIIEIKQCLVQIANEYDLKEVFVTIDKTAIKDGKLPNSRLFTPINASDDDFWNVFDPAIRDSAYFNRLQELYRRLEKEIGTSAGILTEIETANATATAIKRAMYDTFTIVDDMRSNIEAGLNDFFYACDIYANAFNLSPMGEYSVSYDWDYSMLEDSQEAFNQVLTGVNQNVISKAELRNWIKPSETLEESQEKINELEETNPSIQSILGMNNIDNTGSEE